MKLIDTIKNNKTLKNWALLLLMPVGQARPRLWVKWLIHPFILKKGKNASIRNRTRIDVLPFNRFYLGSQSTIEDFTTINNGVGNVFIGDETRIGICSVLIGPVHVGNQVRLAQNVVISGLNHNYQDVSEPIFKQGVSTNQVYIGDETWIGANVVVLPGVFIGKHCVIAAGSVVTKNIPSYSVVAGNPAKVIKTYHQESNSWIRQSA